MDFTLQTYLIYLPFALGTTWMAGNSLFRHGHALLQDVFTNPQTATSVNRLFLAGFYLLSLGYIVLRMPVGHAIVDATMMIEVLSVKIGILLLILGAAHVIIMGVLFRLRRRLRVG